MPNPLKNEALRRSSTNLQELLKEMRLTEVTRDIAVTENSSVEPPITPLDKSKRTSTTMSSGSDVSRKEVRFDPKAHRGRKEEYIKTSSNKKPPTNRILRTLSRDDEGKEIARAAKRGEKYKTDGTATSD